MPNRNLLVILLLVIGLVLVPTACKKKQADTTPTPDEAAATEAPETPPVDRTTDKPEGVEVTEGFQQERPTVEEEVPPSIDEINRSGVLKTVYFEFDKSDLSDEARMVLRANADFLKANGSVGVAVEGHCDERGTIEYNLALGQRRAQAVKDYLASLGVGAVRIRTVSYGEERPVAFGHDEAAWAQNRRAEFVAE
jgi:peptidoglycan-associated lipoprotein